MKATKLLIEIFLLLAVLSCFAFSLEWKYKGYVAHCDNLYHGINKNLNTAAVLYMGNSHAYVLKAYYPDSTQKVKNLSFPGFDLFEEYAMLKKYVPEMKNLKEIYLNLDYEALGYNMSYFGQDYIVRQLYRYSDTLYNNSLMDRLMATSNFFRANRDISFLFTKQKYVPDTTDDINAIPLEQRHNKGDAECRQRALEITSIKFNKQFITQNINLLQQIIDLTKKYHIRLTVFDAPKSVCFISFADKNNMMLSKQKIDSVLQANQLKYLDYYSDSDFTDDDFKNFDHLNMPGVRKLINKMVKADALQRATF